MVAKSHLAFRRDKKMAKWQGRTAFETLQAYCICLCLFWLPTTKDPAIERIIGNFARISFPLSSFLAFFAKHFPRAFKARTKCARTVVFSLLLHRLQNHLISRAFFCASPSLLFSPFNRTHTWRISFCVKAATSSDAPSLIVMMTVWKSPVLSVALRQIGHCHNTIQRIPPPTPKNFRISISSRFVSGWGWVAQHKKNWSFIRKDCTAAKKEGGGKGAARSLLH